MGKRFLVFLTYLAGISLLYPGIFKNIFKEKELNQKSNMHFLHIANSDKPVAAYSDGSKRIADNALVALTLMIAESKTLQTFRHKISRNLLQTLLDKSDNDTREFAANSLPELYGQEAGNYLQQFNDSVILLALDDWRRK